MSTPIERVTEEMLRYAGIGDDEAGARAAARRHATDFLRAALSDEDEMVRVGIDHVTSASASGRTIDDPKHAAANAVRALRSYLLGEAS